LATRNLLGHEIFKSATLPLGASPLPGYRVLLVRWAVCFEPPPALAAKKKKVKSNAIIPVMVAPTAFDHKEHANQNFGLDPDPYPIP
jgi:hypothetical protein